MDPSFLGVPGVGGWVFLGLALASFCTNLAGVAFGAAGGLVLLAILSLVFPPAVLIPVHTITQLGSVSSRLFIMRQWVLRKTLLPFLCGAILGAIAGGQIFISLSTVMLQGILGAFILVVAWLPSFSQIGGLRGRFAVLGFGATFIGVFVSATGTFLAPFIAGASPDRRNYAATFAALMMIVHSLKLAVFAALGVAIGAYLPLVAAMIAMGAAGNWIGQMILERTTERAFRLVFKIVITVLALRLLWVAARDAGMF